MSLSSATASLRQMYLVNTAVNEVLFDKFMYLQFTKKKII